jgi:hypothetical protein
MLGILIRLLDTCLNSDGVTPVFFLNRALNDDFELNPTSYRISRIVSLFLE